MVRQRWDPEQYARDAGFVAELGAPVLELLAPRAGERVLDLGCGDGALTRTFVDRGCRVVAVDASPEQVAAARARGLDARLADAERLAFDAEFDAVFSNAVLHWVKDHSAMLAGVRKALVAGGRFVAEFGGEGNVETIRTALHAALSERGVDPRSVDPWFFPGVDDYCARLTTAGFVVDEAERLPRPTPLPGDISAWLEIFARPFLGAVPAAEREEVIAAVRESVRPVLCDAEHRWSADYVRLRFAAHLPSR